MLYQQNRHFGASRVPDLDVSMVSRIVPHYRSPQGWVHSRGVSGTPVHGRYKSSLHLGSSVSTRRLETFSSSRERVQPQGFVPNYGRDGARERRRYPDTPLSSSRIRECTTETPSCCHTHRYEARGYCLLAVRYIRCLYPSHVWRGVTTRPGSSLTRGLGMSPFSLG